MSSKYSSSSRSSSKRKATSPATIGNNPTTSTKDAILPDILDELVELREKVENLDKKIEFLRSTEKNARVKLMEPTLVEVEVSSSPRRYLRTRAPRTASARVTNPTATTITPAPLVDSYKNNAQDMYFDIKTYNGHPSMSKLNSSAELYKTVERSLIDGPARRAIYLMDTEGLDRQMAKTLVNLYSKDIWLIFPTLNKYLKDTVSVNDLGLEHLTSAVLLKKAFKDEKIHLVNSSEATRLKCFNLIFPPANDVAEKFLELTKARSRHINVVNVRTGYLFVMNDLIKQKRNDEVVAFHTLLWKVFSEMLSHFPYIKGDRKWRQGKLSGDKATRLYFAF